MKRKRTLLIILIFIFLCGIYYIYHRYTYPTFNEDFTVNISPKKEKEIEKELSEEVSFIESVRENDPMNGYTLSTGTLSLSKEGIGKIIDHFKSKNICIRDYQGYYNFVNPQIFKEFWKEYSQQKKTSFVLYSIMSTGEIDRQEFIYDGKQTYFFFSSCTIENGKMKKINTYGNLIDHLSFDKEGFFTYHIIYDEWLKGFDIVDNCFIRIEPIDEELRLLNQKYIQPIGYYCNNLFTQNWDENCLDKINFNDLIEYIYSVDTDKPFLNDLYEYTDTAFLEKIDRKLYENLIQKYFNITTSDLRKWNLYDKETDSYPYTEVYCIPSKFDTAIIRPEVIDAEYKDNILTLTVNALGYEQGYPLAYIHKVKIRLNKEGFQYISNQIIDSKNNKIPEYAPGVTCDLLNEQKQRDE